MFKFLFLDIKIINKQFYVFWLVKSFILKKLTFSLKGNKNNKN